MTESEREALTALIKIANGAGVSALDDPSASIFERVSMEFEDLNTRSTWLFEFVDPDFTCSLTDRGRAFLKELLEKAHGEKTQTTETAHAAD